MARKETADAPSARGFGDIIGIVLLVLAVLLMASLLSYDPRDVSANTAVPNSPAHNWIGPVGAWLGYLAVFVFGAGAYVLPVLLIAFGLAFLFQFLGYLLNRWVWAGVLFLCCLGLLHLYNDSFPAVAKGLNAPSAGGRVGMFEHEFFIHFGRAGATIIYLALYFISLLFLTNFQLGEWLRMLWARREEAAAEGASAEEKALERRKKELEKEERRLREQVEKSPKSAKPDKTIKAIEKPAEDDASGAGLGADLQPVPEPMVRDLSISQSKQQRAAGRKAAEREQKGSPEEAIPVLEGEVISAREIVAATSADILGKPLAPIGSAKATETKPIKDKPDVEPPFDVDPVPVNTAESATALAAATAPMAEPVITIPQPAKPKPAPRKPKPITVASVPTIGNYRLPPLDFLQHPDQTVKPTETKEELMANARLMQQTLAQFDIEVALGDITKGPTITRYELHPAPGVRLEKITALSNNISAALKAERINILAPVPGKSSVGIEVPNLVKTKVIIRDLLESEEWQTTKARIPLALGKDVYGHPIIADLGDMPHLLIAGSTGSGKSVCINSIIASLLYRFSPDQLRFVMIDPKVVELQQYNALPHLVVPVVNDPKKVILALRWVVNEMEKRYKIFAKVGVRNIKSFNERPKDKPIPPAELELPLMAKKEKIEAGADGFAVEVDEEIVVPREDDIVIPEKLSYIVVIIDELADLMLVAPAEVEMAIARITQMARAAGIHCIVATQRPSVDVITGVIKANIPARIAFQVAAKVDSRTILDAMGADKLLGKGDMLYLPPGSAKLIRAQGVLITDQEIQSVVDYIAHQGKPSFELEIHKQLQKPVSSFDSNESGSDEDESLIEQCIEVIRTEKKASVSLLQRRLRLGYTRAARIMDELENRGIVGPSKGAEPRDILLDLDGEGYDGGGQQAV